MSMRVQMVKIPVSSIDGAVPFYREVLGLREDFVMAEYGWAQVCADDMPIALYVPGMGGGNGVAGKCDSLHLATDDEAGLRERLTTANLDPDTYLHTGDDGSRFYDLQDPDGNTVKVMI
jgi:catechol 2,3-dioxygenase-like lactoylglutathione lyase family enzyme